jgi:hypothetical protein
LGLIIFVRVEIGEFAVSPVMEPGAFGALTSGKALPYLWFEVSCDLLSLAGDRRLSAPRAKVVVRFNAQNIAFAGSART